MNVKNRKVQIKIWKRLLALFLCVIMCFGMVQGGILAAEETEDVSAEAVLEEVESATPEAIQETEAGTSPEVAGEKVQDITPVAETKAETKVEAVAEKTVDDKAPEIAPVGDPAAPSIFMLQWTSAADAYLSYNQDKSVCQLTPAANSLSAAGTSAQCTVTFSVGGDVSTAAPGEIQIRLPQYIFQDRDGNPQGNFSCGLPQEKISETRFYYFIDNLTQEIVLENYEPVSSAYIFNCAITYYSTGVSLYDSREHYPHEIRDKYNNTFLAKAKVGENDSTTNALTVGYNTNVKVTKVSKIFMQKYELWQDVWGTKPSDASNYVYSTWSIEHQSVGTQPYSISLSDVPGIGEVVGWASKRDMVGVTSQAPIATYDAPILDANKTYQFGYSYVLVRHPRTALTAAGGVTIKNTVTVTATGIDPGTTNSKQDQHEFKYNNVGFKYDGDSFYLDKSFPVGTMGYLSRLDAAAEGASAGRMNPEFDYDFFALAETVGWSLTLEEGASAEYENYGKVPYRIELTDDLIILDGERLNDDDYSFTACSIFSLYQYNYVKNQTTGNWEQQKDTNYSNWEPVKIQYQMGHDDTWHDFGVVKKTAEERYQFTGIDGTTQSYSKLTEMIPLPAGVTGLHALLDTKYYKTHLRIYGYVALNNTKHIQELTAGQSQVTLFNIDTLRVFDNAGKWVNSEPSNTIKETTLKDVVMKRDQALYREEYGEVYGEHDFQKGDLSRFVPQTVATKDVEYQNDTNKRQVKASYTARMYSYVWNIGMSIADLKKIPALAEERQGTLYDLLPIGMNADSSTIKVATIKLRSSSTTGPPTYEAGTTCPYTFELVDNWRGSGRTMMIVHVTVPDNVENFSSKGDWCASGYTLTYDAYYSWDCVADFGTSPRNSIAYQSENDLGTTAYADNGGTLIDKGLFNDLDGDGNPGSALNSSIYAQVAKTFPLDTSAELSFSKTVKTTAGTIYGQEAAVIGGGDYTYRLRTASQKDYKTSNIILYDSLETGKPQEANRFMGTLESVDVSYAQSKGIDVITYYSTQAGLTLAKGSANLDLTDTTIWSTEPPANLADVKALAFDMRKATSGSDYVLQPGSSVYVLVNMKAPVENVTALEEAGAAAYNTAWQSTTQTNTINDSTSSDVLETQATKVTISAPRAAIHKSSNPASGTATTPTTVEADDTIIYDISIKNNEPNFSLKDIEVVDAIPAGLTIDYDQIKWYSGGDSANQKPVSDADHITVTSNGQTLTFKLDKLIINETIHLVIPTTVVKGAVDRYENTAKLTKVNGVTCDVASETTYHDRVALGDLKVTKTVAGNAGSTTHGFAFTVTLSDTTISGVYGDMTFVDGVATFELSDGDEKTATDLPGGVGYTVAERDYTTDGYVTISTDGSGTITDGSGTITGDSTETVAFTNTRNANGSLTVSKKLAGNDTNGATKFTFKITLSDTTINETFSEVKFTDGVAVIQLAGGQSKVIEGLPNGIGYRVEETDNAGYAVTSIGATGTISESAAAVAAFTNTRNTYGKLTVSKTVAGAGGSTQKAFAFTVTLSDKTITGTYGDMTFVSGVANLELKHNESKTANGLPNGLAYTVSESSYTSEGYVTTKSGDTGVIIGNRTKTAAFTNTWQAKASPAPTSIVLKAKKSLKGRTLEADEFMFVLKAGGEVLAEAANGADGSIVFPKITYDQAGTYTYTMSETAGTDRHITYDRSAYKVVVTVVEKDGKLVATAKITKDNKGVSSITFSNVYRSVLPLDREALKAVSIEKAVDQTAAETEDYLTYTIKVKNVGEAVLKDVAVNDVIPKCTTYVRSSGGGELIHAVTGDYVQWIIATIKPGKTAILTFVVKVDDCVEDQYTVTNTAKVIGNPNDKKSNTVKTVITQRKDPLRIRMGTKYASTIGNRNGTRIGKTGSAKTGDNAPISLYLLMISAACAVAGVLLIRKRKKVND